MAACVPCAAPAIPGAVQVGTNILVGVGAGEAINAIVDMVTGAGDSDTADGDAAEGGSEGAGEGEGEGEAEGDSALEKALDQVDGISAAQKAARGSALISRTHPKRPIIRPEECHGEPKEVFRRVQTRSGAIGNRAWRNEEPGGQRAGDQRELVGSMAQGFLANGSAAFPGHGKPRDEEMASLKIGAAGCALAFAVYSLAILLGGTASQKRRSEEPTSIDEVKELAGEIKIASSTDSSKLYLMLTRLKAAGIEARIVGAHTYNALSFLGQEVQSGLVVAAGDAARAIVLLEREDP